MAKHRIFSRVPAPAGALERGDVVEFTGEMSPSRYHRGAPLKAIVTGPIQSTGPSERLYPAVITERHIIGGGRTAVRCTEVFIDPRDVRRVGRVQRVPVCHYGRVKRPALPRTHAQLAEEQGRLRHHLKRADPAARRLLEHKAFILDRRFEAMPAEPELRDVSLPDFAATVARAHSEPEAAVELDSWIKGRGGVPQGAYSTTSGRRATPLSLLLLEALREAGDAGLQRGDMALIAYRSRYPGCPVEEAHAHRGQCSVMIGQLMSNWGKRNERGRWVLASDRPFGPPYLSGNVRHR